MLKHHKLISFCLALLFLLVLQTFATPVPVFRFLLPAFLLFCGGLALYDRWYLKQVNKYNIWTLLRPVLLLLSLFGLFIIIPSTFIRGLFLIVSVGLITLFQITMDYQAENILLNQTLVIAFGLFFSFFAFYYYFPGYEPLYLVGLFTGTALLSRSFYELLPKSGQTKQLGALIIGFFCAQIFWALNFLPFHFSVLSVFLFNIFYFCLILNYYHLFHMLNFKKVQFHLFLILACDIVVLLATPWRIIA